MAERPVRIASLLASATEIVTALGLEDKLIAISHECDYPPHILDRPRVSRPRFDPEGMDSGAIDRAVRDALLEHGSVYEIDADTLETLRPTIILTQAVCDVCAVPTPGVRQVVAARGIDADVVSLDAHTLEQIYTTIEAVGQATGHQGTASTLVSELRARVDRVRDAVRQRSRPNVLAIEWLDPPFLPGHWVPEMIDAAGGTMPGVAAGERSRQTTWDDLAGANPDVLVIMPCGYGLDASRADADRHAAHLRAVAPRAIANGNAWVVDGSSYFNRSGPRTVDGIEILAAVLHPDVLGPPDPRAAARWPG